jgi:hypothetical protein
MTLAMLAQVACTQQTADDEEVVEVQQPEITTNALIDNALIDNALIDNALIDNALIDNALIDNALIDNALIDNALNDPNARELFKYIVSCALPADQHIHVDVGGATYTFDGALGVAPEWGEERGSCDAECRSWVSGCVISRLDYLGQQVLISVRGKNSGLQTTLLEWIKYPHMEATYYGDIFSHPQKIFACLPAWKHNIPRVCGPSLADCVVDVQGNCDDLCDGPRLDGSYTNCREAPTVGKHGKIQKGEKHVGSVTVFLK